MVTFSQLVPPGRGCTAVQALDGWRDEPAPRPGRSRVALNMIASVDGRVAIDGRSAPLGGPADRELFHALRAQADAVMAAAGTVRTERYGPLIRDAATRARREAAGLEPQPLALIVSRSLDLDPSLPLLADPESRVVIIGPSAGSLGATAASVEYVRTDKLDEALVEVRERFGTGVIVCEGGPSLNGSLLAQDVIDELFVATSPMLVGGDSGPSLVSGESDPVLRRLALSMLLSFESQLYARYVVLRS